MNDVWNVIAGEFADLPNVAEAVRVSMRLLMAAILGGILGYEREQQGKNAGLRTHMLVSAGAALFVLVPQQAGMSEEGISRVIQGLLAGIGFLGAGTILHLEGEHKVKGLTTAAGIWFTAAIGIAVGLGREATAILSTILAVVIIAVLPRFERAMQSRAKGETKHVRTKASHGKKE